MQRVVILSEEEYDDLIGVVDAVNSRMKELEKIVDDKDALQEYIREWLN